MWLSMNCISWTLLWSPTTFFHCWSLAQGHSSVCHHMILCIPKPFYKCHCEVNTNSLDCEWKCHLNYFIHMWQRRIRVVPKNWYNKWCIISTKIKINKTLCWLPWIFQGHPHQGTGIRKYCWLNANIIFDFNSIVIYNNTDTSWNNSPTNINRCNTLVIWKPIGGAKLPKVFCVLLDTEASKRIIS